MIPASSKPLNGNPPNISTPDIQANDSNNTDRTKASKMKRSIEDKGEIYLEVQKGFTALHERINKFEATTFPNMGSPLLIKDASREEDTRKIMGSHMEGPTIIPDLAEFSCETQNELHGMTAKIGAITASLVEQSKEKPGTFRDYQILQTLRTKIDHITNVHNVLPNINVRSEENYHKPLTCPSIVPDWAGMYVETQERLQVLNEMMNELEQVEQPSQGVSVKNSTDTSNISHATDLVLQPLDEEFTKEKFEEALQSKETRERYWALLLERFRYRLSSINIPHPVGKGDITVVQLEDMDEKIQKLIVEVNQFKMAVKDEKYDSTSERLIETCVRYSIRLDNINVIGREMQHEQRKKMFIQVDQLHTELCKIIKDKEITTL